MLTLALLTVSLLPQGGDDALAARIRAAAQVRPPGHRFGILPADRKCPYCRKPLTRVLLEERNTIEGRHGDIALVCVTDELGYLTSEGLMSGGESGPFALPKNDAEARAGLEPFGTRVIAPRRTMETDWNSVTYSPDLRYGAGGGHDSVMRVWSTEVLVQDDDPMGPTASVFSPKSDAFAVARSGGKLLVWELPSGRSRVFRSKNLINISALAFDPATEHLAVFWLENTTPVLQIRRVRGGAVTARLDAAAMQGIAHMAWSADGSRLAAGDWKGNLRVWDVAGSRVVTRHAAGEPIRDLHWGDAGDHVAVATGRQGWAARVVEVASGQARILTAEPSTEGAAHTMPSIAIDRHGERFAWLLPDDTIVFGDVDQGEIRSHFGATGQGRIEIDGAEGFRTQSVDGRRIHWDPARGLPTERIRRGRP